MSANVESMFYVGREAPWHGLGTSVEKAPTSREALTLAGLDWKVAQRSVYTNYGTIIDGYKANVRDDTNAVLGIVTDRYRVVQNEEAFAFTDALLSHGVEYETAGSLNGGRRIWLLAKLPDRKSTNWRRRRLIRTSSRCYRSTGSRSKRQDCILRNPTVRQRAKT